MLAILQEQVRQLTLANGSLQTQIQNVERNSILQYFQEDGRRLPGLHQDGTTTGPTPNTNHAKIDSFEQKEFGLLEMTNEDLEDMRLEQASIPFKEKMRYSTEMDVQQYCKQFLDDMIKASKLSQNLSLRCDLQIAELKADFWVISCNGFPVGAIEVKKPGKGNPETNYGQLFDYMLRIRSFHGIRSVFGICTNFLEWTICWLPDSDVAALATSLDYSSAAVSSTVPILRILNISETYKRDSRALALAITSVLKKMNKSAETVDPVPLKSESRPYIVLTDASWHWQTGLSVKLTLRPPTRSTKKFYLLRDFHGGADGRVWLACSFAGNIAVIKFQRRLHETESGDEKSRVDKEVLMWHQCGIKSVFAGKFSGRHAVVMPFGFHYTNTRDIDDNWWKGESAGSESIEHLQEIREKCSHLDPKTVLEGCIERCAKVGIAHDDIEWRHIAIFPKITEKIPYLRNLSIDLVYAFIDLGRMKSFRIGSKTEWEKSARNEMSGAKDRLLADIANQV